MSEAPTPAAAVTLSGVHAQLQASLQLIAGAQQQLRILSQDLDRRVWGEPAIVECVRTFALRSQRAELRVLLKQPQRTAQRGHPLVELARRLPSRIALHELSEEHLGINEEFAIADESAVLYKSRPDALDTQWFAQAPLEARRLRRRFDLLWDESSPARELATLGI